MNFRVIIAISLLAFSLQSFSQNLVPNPSFEDTIPCSLWLSMPIPPGPITDWFTPNNSTPDWFADSTLCSSGMPSNLDGFQFPRTGIAYAGFLTKSNAWPPPFSTREYLSCQLTQPLQQNKSYCVGFYVSRAEKMHYSTDGMGAYFSPDTPSCMGNFCLLQYTPQISNAPGNILSDSTNWVLISGSFTAVGGEKFITIGNFIPDSLNALDSISIWTYPEAYYYIDDVYVIELPQDSLNCFDGVGVEEIKKQEEFLLFPNPVSDELRVQSLKLKVEGIEIYDVLGQRVFSVQNINTKETTVNVSNLKEGIYFVRLKANDKLIGNQKLVIVK